MKSVVVVGGGLAAMSASLTVAARVEGAHVMLIRPHAKTMTETYQGLWTPSIMCLSNRKVFGNAFKQLKMDGGRFMTEAGYRNAESGKWIARPSQCMPSPVHVSSLDPRQPALFFVRESKLIDILQDQIEKSDNVEVVNDSYVVSFEEEEKYIKTVITQNEERYSCDHLIVADGKFSPCRALLNAHSPLHYRGYRVTRGLTSRNVTGNTSFQSWGKGTRFATVPVGRDSNIWFYTNSEEECPESLDPSTDHIYGENALRSIKDATFHDPIGEIIADTVTSTVHAQSALESFGSIYDSKKSNVYFVGDAARTLDPILAVGAGLAIEDGFDVANTISSSSGQRNKASMDRESRIRRLRFLSNLSQFSGQMNSSLLISIRDMLCTANTNLTSKMFDSFMSSSVRLTSDEVTLFRRG